MFNFDGNIKFINVDTQNLKALHDACDEVFFSNKNYDNKPYIGILLNSNGRKYVIPLTSAKPKHIKWPNVSQDRMLIYEIVNASRITKDDIYVVDPSGNVKHILSAIDIKKMIPIKDGVYSFVNINYSPTDTADEKKYKDLLNKEYAFCVKIANSLLSKANKIYNKQISTGKIINFCCDFIALEEACDKYK